MKKFLCIALALCLCIASASVFAEEKKADAKPDNKEEKIEELNDDQMDIIDLVIAETVVYNLLVASGETNNEVFKEITKDKEAFETAGKVISEKPDFTMKDILENEKLKNYKENLSKFNEKQLKALCDYFTAVFSGSDEEQRLMDESIIPVVLYKLAVLADMLKKDLPEEVGKFAEEGIAFLDQIKDPNLEKLKSNTKAYFEKLIKEVGKKDIVDSYKALLEVVAKLPFDKLKEYMKDADQLIKGIAAGAKTDDAKADAKKA